MGFCREVYFTQLVNMWFTTETISSVFLDILTVPHLPSRVFSLSPFVLLLLFVLCRVGIDAVFDYEF